MSTFIAGESVLTSQRTAPGSVQQSPKDSVVTGLSSLAGPPEFMLPSSDHMASYSCLGDRNKVKLGEHLS